MIRLLAVTLGSDRSNGTKIEPESNPILARHDVAATADGIVSDRQAHSVPYDYCGSGAAGVGDGLWNPWKNFERSAQQLFAA